MLKRLKTILIISLLLVASGAMAQLYTIDKVCQFASRNYKVTGEPNSTYTWTITDQLLNVTTLPDTTDHITINWIQPRGVYVLSVMQHAENGCDALLQEGNIFILNPPQAFAGNPFAVCSDATIALTQATAQYYSALLWTSNGDGTFNNDTITNPIYTPGPADRINGNVLLTLTAQGTANPGSCVAAVSSVAVSINSILASLTITPSSCSGASTGSVAIAASGGTAPYTYTLNGVTNTTGYFAGLASGNYPYSVNDNIGCSFDGIAVVDGTSELNASISATNISCNNFGDGTITVSAQSGGSGIYQYSLDNLHWQSGSIFTSLQSGSYTVYMRDATSIDCFKTLGTVTITEPAPIGLVAQVTHTSCGLDNGRVLLLANGGSGTYLFTLDSTAGWSQNNLYALFAKGTYTAMVRDYYGCPAVTTISFTIDSLPMPEITYVHIISATNGNPNGKAGIEASGVNRPFQYSLDGINWQPDSLFTGLAVGNYTAYIKDSRGCIATKPFVMFNTVAGAVQVLAGNVESCLSVPFEIPVMAYDFTSIKGFSIQMQYDSTAVDFGGLTQIHTELNNGMLTTQVVGPGKIQITFIANDSISMLSEELLFQLNFSGLAPGETLLQWDSLQCVIYAAAGYDIPAIYTKGIIDIRPAPQVFTTGGGAYCAGNPLLLEVGSLAGDNLKYQWKSPSGITHDFPQWNLGEATSSAAGIYEVTATDLTSCTKKELVPVVVNPNPSINISYYDTLCSESSVLLSPGSGYVSYLWQDGSKNQELLAEGNGVFWVIVTDENGCSTKDQVVLHPCELYIYVPNAFTPNNDELNDTFNAITNVDGDFSFQMIVYNKWGEEIFSSTNIHKGWDGTYKGKECPADVYTWIIRFDALNNYNFSQKSPQSGTVTLLR